MKYNHTNPNLSIKRNAHLLVKIFLLIISTLSTSHLFAQNCIDYPNIEGSTCIECTPTGWSAALGTPDIIPPSGFYDSSCSFSDLSGPSPSGGNMVLLAGGESMITTISGLDTGIEYAFGIYWEGVTTQFPCLFPLSEGDLEVIIDGVSFDYSGASDWTLEEICFTPSSSTIDIQLTHAGVLFSSIVIDSAPCSFITPCCELTLDADPLNYNVCPGEAINLLASYAGETGTVIINWNSSDPSALGFLSSTTEISPTFLYPNLTNSTAQVFKYSLTVMDDNCEITEDCIEVTVEPSIIPQFTIDLCETDLTAMLPTTSDDGYSGVWTGNFNIENLGGQSVDYTFTLDPNQGNCLESSVYTILIEEALDPLFSVVLSYCELDDTQYTLPLISDNSIFGSWNSSNLFTPSLLGSGSYLYAFVPTSGCASSLTVEIVIEPSSTISFTLDAEYCEESNTVVLPTGSNEGVSGTWSPVSIDLSVTGNGAAIFTPDNNNLCTSDFTYNYIVNPLINPSFNLDLDYCLDNNTVTLPTSSIEGITGSWDIPTIDLNVVQSGTASFTPDGGQCADVFQYNFNVIQSINPTFNLVATYCSENNVITLPNVSNEGITGTWDIPMIDLNIVQTSSSTFTPTVGDCAETFVYTYEVILSVEPTFNLPLEYCTENSIVTLPQVSAEGITGSWDIPTIDLNVVQSGTASFTPDSGQCADVFQYNFDVETFIVPSFDLSELYCTQLEILVLPTSSLEGITGSWNIPTIDLNAVQEGSVTFTPDEVGCAAVATFSYSVEQSVMVTFDLPSQYCSENNLITLPTTSLEGISGSWDIPTINLNQAQSGIAIFVTDDVDCIDSFNYVYTVESTTDLTFTLPSSFCVEDETFILPTISDEGISGSWDVVSIELSDAIANGVAVFTPDDSTCSSDYTYQYTVENALTPTFDIAEYACIDTDSLFFTDISLEGILGTWEYSVVAIDTLQGNIINNTFTPNDVSCAAILSISIELLDFDNLTINVLDPTECQQANGVIGFEGNLDQYQISLDGGNTWLSILNFTSLEAGIYNFQIRLTSLLGCVESYTIQLVSPESPEIENIEVVNVADCLIDNGTIAILSMASGVEYSIDGFNWFNNGLFENLGVGNYTVSIRFIDNPNCPAESMVTITGPADIDLEGLDINQITACGASDGTVSLSTQLALEYSIDGINWTQDPLFLDIPAGSYFYYGRDINFPSCIDSMAFEIVAPDSPLITDVIVIQPTLCNENSGEITILPVSNELEYSIDNGVSWSPANSFKNLESGNYIIQIRLVNNPTCTDQQNVVINEVTDIANVELVILTELTDCDSEDASIIANTNIVDPEYSLDNVVYQTANVFVALSYGTFNVYVRSQSNQNCTTTRSIEINRPECPCNDLAIEYQTTNTSCGESNGSITVSNIEGAISNDVLILDWSTGESTFEIEDLASGQYFVTVTYDTNCTYIDSISIEAAEFSFGLQSFDQTCDELGLVEVTELEGGQGDFQFSLDNVDFQAQSVFFNLNADEYEVYVSNFFDCSGDALIDVGFDNNLEFSLPPIEPIILGQSIFLNPLINIETIDSFEWNNTEYILNPGELIANVAPDQTTEFTLLIYFGSCVEERTIIVEVEEEEGKIYLPNVLNTSSNSGNGIFYPMGKNSDQMVKSLSIYDRWGSRVFYKQDLVLNDEASGWDATFKGQYVAQGVYVYMIELYPRENSKNIITGDITVLR